MTRKSNLFRMTVDISAEDHKHLKALAANLGKNMDEILSDWIHEKLNVVKEPNATTLNSIKRIENGKDLVEAKNAQDMFRKLGI